MSADGPIRQQLIQRLTDAAARDGFPLCGLIVHNESQAHGGPDNAETHFRVVVATDVFQSKKLLARHRWVNAAVGPDLLNDNVIHALSIEAKSAEEWYEEGGSTMDPLPACVVTK